MSRTFVLEPCNLSVSQAQRYGETVYLFNKNEARSSIWDATFQDEIIESLRRYDYDPDEDFFVVVGRMVPMVIAVTTLVDAYKKVRVLFYSATERTYVVRTIKCDTFIKA